MPSTYSQIYLHHVSAVKYRNALILPEFEEQLYQYIGGIVKELDETLLEVNGMLDHIHIGFRLRPRMACSDFIRVVKTNTSKWINDNDFLDHEFNWQKGGATFSVSRTHVDPLRYYIRNQKQHHKKVSFRQEYTELLIKNGVDIVEEHLPEFFDGLY